MRQLRRYLIFGLSGGILFFGIGYVNLLVAPQVIGNQFYIPVVVGITIGLIIASYVNRLANSRDLLEQQVKERTSELKAANTKLKYELDVKTRFFSIISHDLTGPFTSLLGMTEMMSLKASSMSSDQLAEYATNTNKAGVQVFELLDNLLEWSYLQMENTNLSAEIIRLDKLAQECLDIHSPIAQKKDITLTNRIEDSTAFADPKMVRVVFRNLIANAIKFSPTGGVVKISAHNADGMVQITVSDTGVGVTPDQVVNIFSLTQGASTSGTAGEKGTGLGLPLCKEMIEENGGRIWVDSLAGEGAHFHFSLPIKPNDD